MRNFEVTLLLPSHTPDLADNGSLAGVLGEPIEDTLVGVLVNLRRGGVVVLGPAGGLVGEDPASAVSGEVHGAAGPGVAV